MKLLVVGPEMRDRRKIKNFTGVQAYYLTRELRKRGVDLHFVDNKHPEPLKYLADVDGTGCDHVLALGLRWFTHAPVGCAAILKTKVPGAVTQLHDGLIHESLAAHMNGVDCTFTFRDDATRTRDWDRYAKSNHYIGWAADPELLYSEQNGHHLRILIDHPYYKGGKPDITEALTRDAVLFMRGRQWKHQWQGVRIRRLINGGAEDVYPHDPMLRQFSREHVPFEDIAREYRQAHVYINTHKESVGLTCLELAMCGALVLAPEGFLYLDRLATFRHIEFAGVRVPWSRVLDEINLAASREMALQQSWDKVADRMLAWFASYDRNRLE